jgi:hypothetical protein
MLIMRALILPMLTLVACGAPTQTGPTPTYFHDIQPIVERSCQSCHRTGGIAPFSLQDPNTAVQMSAAMLADLESGKMPPFYASTSCNSYQHDPRLSADEMDLFRRWVNGGSPLGNEADSQHAVVEMPAPVRHDVDMAIAPYDVRADGGTANDNYHCFPLDPQQAADVMVTGYEVSPGSLGVVHHVLAYVVPPSQLAQLQALDDAEPGPGYSCLSGGVGIPNAIQNEIAGWVPGSAPAHLPSGSGLVLAGGSRIIMQVHYNLLALGRGASATDQTHLALELAPMGSVRTAKILPMLKHNLAINAFDANSVQVQEVSAFLFSGATIYSLAGHMHLLGSEVKLELVHGSGASTCLVDEKNWDFNWQRAYELVNPVHVLATDKIRITCTYDNSQAHQPYVNGAQQTSRDVTWGESSLDEMCMTYVTYLP